MSHSLSISELASIHYARNDTSYCAPAKRKAPHAFAIITEDGIDQIETTAARAKRHAKELRDDYDMGSEIVEFPNETAAYEWADSVIDTRRWLSAARSIRKAMKAAK